MNIGVVVGRFQVPELHSGHISLLDKVSKENDRVIVVLGKSPLMSTERNPLTVEQRVKLFKDQRCIIGYIPDCKSDEEWSSNLDVFITACGISGGDFVTLYGSRDSFIPHYSGGYRCKIVEMESKHSGTSARANVPSTGGKKYRSGVIFGAKNRWVNAMPCVDVAIVDHGMVLLGRKRNSKVWQFIGGFVDSGESYESAAIREVKEETGLDISNPRYLNSYVIDDWRYKSEKVKITSAFFSAEYIGGTPVASDDIEEVKWFKINSNINIADGHKDMLYHLAGIHRM